MPLAMIGVLTARVSTSEYMYAEPLRDILFTDCSLAPTSTSAPDIETLAPYSSLSWEKRLDTSLLVCVQPEVRSPGVSRAYTYTAPEPEAAPVSSFPPTVSLSPETDTLQPKLAAF